MFLAWFIPIIVVFIVLFFVIAIKVGKKKKFVSKTKIPSIDSKKQAGEEAERIVNNRIQKLISNKLKGQGISHPKFIFFVYKQDTCEIDNLVVTKGGIFIIETKNWKGEITGNLNDKNWTKTKKYNYTKFTYDYDIQSLENPIQENDRHLNNFSNIWKKVCNDIDIPKITPIVIFPYSKNPPEGTHNIESAFSLIIKLSKHGSYSVTKIENIILKIIEKYGATEEDHIKTINRLEQKHKNLSS